MWLLGLLYFYFYAFTFTLLSLLSVFDWQVINWKTRTSVDRHSQSLDDIHLFSPPTPLGTLPQANTSHSYTFGLPESHISLKNHQHPITQCPAKPSFYGRRSTNCLSLDLLEDEQLLELIL